MAFRRNLMGDGSPTGATYDAAESASVNGNWYGFDNTSIVGGATATVVDGALHGKATRINAPAGGSAIYIYNTLPAAARAVQVIFRMASHPVGGNTDIVQWRAGSILGRLSAGQDGKLSAQAAGGVLVPGSATPLILGEWLQLDAVWFKGEANSRIRYRLKQLTGTAAGAVLKDWDSGPVIAGGTEDSTNFRCGKITSATVSLTGFDIDTVAYRDATADYIADFDPAAGLPPEAHAGSPADVEPLHPATLDASLSVDIDGTVTGYSWRFVDASNALPAPALTGAGPTRRYLPPLSFTGGALTWGVRVTDDKGNQSEEVTVTHTVLPATESLRVGGVDVPVVVIGARPSLGGGTTPTDPGYPGTYPAAYAATYSATYGG